MSVLLTFGLDNSLSWGAVLCIGGRFHSIADLYPLHTNHIPCPSYNDQCPGAGVQHLIWLRTTILDLMNNSYKGDMVFSRNWNNLNLTGTWNMKWKLVLNQARFIPYLENPVNYFGLYLNSTGKLAKLVNDRMVWFRYIFRKY